MKKMKLKLKVIKVSLVALMGLVLTGTTFILKDDKSNAYNAVGSGQESHTQTIPAEKKTDYAFNSDYFSIDGSSDIIKITVQNTYTYTDSYCDMGICYGPSVDPSKEKLTFFIKEERPNANDGYLFTSDAKTKTIDGKSVTVYGHWHLSGSPIYEKILKAGETETVYVSPDKKSGVSKLKYIFVRFYNMYTDPAIFPGATVTFTRTHVPW